MGFGFETEPADRHDGDVVRLVAAADESVERIHDGSFDSRRSSGRATS